jgi:hypothetical protein
MIEKTYPKQPPQVPPSNDERYRRWLELYTLVMRGQPNAHRTTHH